MKKIAVISSNEGLLLEAIVRYLKDVETTCISFNEESLSIERAKYLNINWIKTNAEELNNLLNKNNFDLVVSEDIINNEFDCVSIYPSLLPSFSKSENPIFDAITEGCKVTGLSVLYKNKIIAQYPVFITNDMHYDDLELRLSQVAQVMYPLVIEKVLNNEAFEIQNLMQKSHCSSCNGSCSGCK